MAKFTQRTTTKNCVVALAIFPPLLPSLALHVRANPGLYYSKCINK